MKVQTFGIEPFLTSSVPICKLSIPVITFLLKFMFNILSRFSVSLLILNQFPILMDSHCIGVSFVPCASLSYHQLINMFSMSL